MASKDVRERNDELMQEYLEMKEKTCTPNRIEFLKTQWRVLSRNIDFPLDQATPDQVREIVDMFVNDQITDSTGESYSPHIKRSYLKFLRAFYVWFIGGKGEGRIEEVDGKKIADGIDLSRIGQ